MRVKELIVPLEELQSRLVEHRDLWGQSLAQPIPDYPVHNRQKLARPQKVKMFRIGTCYNHTPNSVSPMVFSYDIEDPKAPPETWSQGLEIYHNPRATTPLPRNFLSLAYHYHDGERLHSYLHDFHPYGSRTVVIQLRDD